jgi:DNA-binding GntR family transcriptional regulator
LPDEALRLCRLIGASRQKVNQHLRRWAADGLLDRQPGALRLRDPDGLAEIAAAGRA